VIFSTFEQSAASNPTQVNQAITALNSAINPIVTQAITPDTGLIASKTTSYESE